MGVVLSASAVQNVGGSSGAHTFSHPFSGKGAVVLITRADNHNNEVSAVSVGGVALARQDHGANFTPARHAEVWAVASGIGTGSLTVSITQPGSQVSFAVAIDVTNDSGGPTVSIGAHANSGAASGTHNASLDSGTKDALGMSCMTITDPGSDLTPQSDNVNIATSGASGGIRHLFAIEQTNTVGVRSLGWSTGNNPKAGVSLLMLDDGPSDIALAPATSELTVEAVAGISVSPSGDVALFLTTAELTPEAPDGIGIETTYPLQVALVGSDVEVHRHTSGGVEGDVLTFHEESEPTWETGGGGSGTSDHGGLTGLSDDDHLQYAILVSTGDPPPAPGRPFLWYDPADPGGDSLSLDELGDVNAPSPSDGQVLTWDSTPGEWVATTPSAASSLTVEEVDGSPSVSSVDKIIFPAGTVTSLGSGDVSIAEVPAGVEAYEASLGADVTMTNANQFYDGPSLTLPAGKWLIVGQLLVRVTAANDITGKLWDGTTVEASAAVTPRTNTDTATLPFVGFLDLSTSATWKISAASNGTAGTIKAAAPNNGAGNNGSRLVAYRLGTGSVAGLQTARAKRTSGNITLNSTSWANVDTGLDLVIPAEVGDVLFIEGSFAYGNEAVAAGIDAVTVVSGSPVNSVSGANGASDFGVQAWLGPSGTGQAAGGGIQYPVVSGDISGGNVTLRLRYRTASASNKTLGAATTQPLHWSVVNLRGGPRTDFRSGTAFPTSPTTGQVFHRTDLTPALYRYDGTRWLCTCQHELSAYIAGTSGHTATTAAIGRIPLNHSSGLDIYIDEVVANMHIATTNNGTNYWTVEALKLDFANASTSLGTANSSADAANTWLSKSFAVGSIVDISAFPGPLRIDVTKTASPGTLTVAVMVKYRLIAT